VQVKINEGGSSEIYISIKTFDDLDLLGRKISDLAPVFSFNWTTWPFVEVGDSVSPALQNVLPEALVDEIKAWSEYFLETFDENTGFSTPYAKSKVNREYDRLCKMLDDLGISYRANNWWSNL